jgi:hypothetical protein
VGRLVLARATPSSFFLVGGGLFVAGWVGDTLPAYYAHQDFWRASPQWLAMRLGLVVATSGLLQLLPASADRGLSWLRTLGRHSLLGYFVSVELPYGALLAVLHKRLPLAWSIWAIVAMSAATWVASALADRWDAWRAAADRRSRPAAAPG